MFKAENMRQFKRSFVGKFPKPSLIQPVNTILLRNCIFFAWNHLLEINNQCEGDEFIKHNFYQPTYKFSEKLLS